MGIHIPNTPAAIQEFHRQEASNPYSAEEMKWFIIQINRSIIMNYNLIFDESFSKFNW